MKKISYILCTLGVSLIIMAIILITTNKIGIDSFPWNKEYERGTYDDKNISEYNTENYKTVMINQNRINAQKYYPYIVPNDTYLYSNLTYSVGYKKNDDFYIIRNISLIKPNDIDNINTMINKYEAMTFLNISSYQLSNGNLAYLIKMADNNNYEENLMLFIKADEGYYKVEYHLNNQKFSNNFLKNVLKDNIEINQEKQNDDSVWNLSLDIPIKKKISLKYDNTKYQLAKNLLFEDYMLMLYDNNQKVVKIKLLYDTYDYIDQSIYLEYNGYGGMINETKIKGYQVKKYIFHEDVDLTAYLITIDSEIKMLVSTVSSSNIDINDFLNFTYE